MTAQRVWQTSDDPRITIEPATGAAANMIEGGERIATCHGCGEVLARGGFALCLQATGEHAQPGRCPGKD